MLSAACSFAVVRDLSPPAGSASIPATASRRTARRRGRGTCNQPNSADCSGRSGPSLLTCVTSSRCCSTPARVGRTSRRCDDDLDLDGGRENRGREQERRGDEHPARGRRRHAPAPPQGRTRTLVKRRAARRRDAHDHAAGPAPSGAAPAANARRSVPGARASGHLIEPKRHAACSAGEDREPTRPHLRARWARGSPPGGERLRDRPALATSRSPRRRCTPASTSARAGGDGAGIGRVAKAGPTPRPTRPRW